MVKITGTSTYFDFFKTFMFLGIEELGTTTLSWTPVDELAPYNEVQKSVVVGTLSEAEFVAAGLGTSEATYMSILESSTDDVTLSNRWSTTN